MHCERSPAVPLSTIQNNLPKKQVRAIRRNNALEKVCISTVNDNCKNGHQKASKTINKSFSRLSFVRNEERDSKERAQEAGNFSPSRHGLQSLPTRQVAASRNERKRKKGTHADTHTHTRHQTFSPSCPLSSGRERERGGGQECAAHYQRRRERGKKQCRICAGRHLGHNTSRRLADESCLPTGGPTVPGGLTSCREASETIAGTGVISVAGASPQTTKGGGTRKKAPTPAAVPRKNGHCMHYCSFSSAF